jgi:hypothetical protein
LYANYSYRKASVPATVLPTGLLWTRLMAPVFQNQIADQSFDFNSHNIRAGIDFNLDDKTTLGFSGNANLRNRNRFQYGDTRITDGLTGVLNPANQPKHQFVR